MEVSVARAVGMCLWSQRARLITTADCVGDGRNTLAAHRGGGGGVGECPQRESGSQMLLSLPPPLSLSLSLSLSLLSTALTLRRDPRLRLGNPGGILFNIYIYIYMSNGDRPSASLVKG